MSEDIILDPSMLFHEPTLEVIKALYAEQTLGEIFLPSRFIQVVNNEPELYEYFEYFIPPADKAHPSDVIEFVRTARESFLSYEVGISEDNPFFQRLLEETPNELIARTVFEEWDFINSRSWLFSRLRRALDAMTRAGAAGLSLSQDAFDRLARRILRLPPDAP